LPQNAALIWKIYKGTEAEFMQRPVSRSHCFSQNVHAAWNLVGWGLVVACLAFGQPGAAAEPDNVLLDFTATWCGPCQAMSSIVSRLERQGYPIRKVDVDQEPGLAARYRVQSIPCFVLVANGKEVDRVTGGTTEAQLRGMLNRLPRPEARATGTARGNGTGDRSRAAEPRRPGALEPSLGDPSPLALPLAERSRDARDEAPPQRGVPGIFDADFASNPPPVDEGIQIRAQTGTADPMRSSVRIRVKDGNHISFGSGTIIDSQAGQAVVLTCAHIFRKMSKSALLEVDLNLGVKTLKPETVAGRVLLTDSEADVGLVLISVPYRLPVVPLGFTAALSAGDALMSIGCGGGDIPTRANVELLHVNRYNGPENLECTMRPQQGRSGGGLFHQDELVGICVLADPRAPRGIYSGLQPVIPLLEKAGLTHLLPKPANSVAEPDQNSVAHLIEERAPLSETQAVREPAPAAIPAAVPAAVPPVRLATADDEVARLLAQQLGDAAPQDLAGAEIICIVRSRVPGQPSRVVIVNQASSRFVADLLGESTGNRDGLMGSAQSQPVETSLQRTVGPRSGLRP